MMNRSSSNDAYRLIVCVPQEASFNYLNFKTFPFFLTNSASNAPELIIQKLALVEVLIQNTDQASANYVRQSS